MLQKHCKVITFFSSASIFDIYFFHFDDFFLLLLFIQTIIKHSVLYKSPY